MKLSKLHYQTKDLLRAPVEIQKYCAQYYKRDL